MLTAEEQERYRQQMQLCELGEAGQLRLKSASIAVVGAGGLGCPVLQYLVAAGVGRIGIVDPDRVELSNLHRQTLYSACDVGQRKVDVAKKKLSSNLETYPARLTADNASELLSPYDLVVDASDNFPTRYAINDTKKPWIYGALDRFSAQVAVFTPDGPDYRSLYPEPPDHTLSCSGSGTLGPLPGIVGSIQALEAIKMASGIGSSLAGRLLTIDALTWRTRLYNLRPFDPPSWELSPQQLAQLMRDNREVHLLDARHQLSELVMLPRDAIIVLYCERGIRSAMAARHARTHQGYTNIYTLKRGELSTGKQD